MYIYYKSDRKFKSNVNENFKELLKKIASIAVLRDPNDKCPINSICKHDVKVGKMIVIREYRAMFGKKLSLRELNNLLHYNYKRMKITDKLCKIIKVIKHLFEKYWEDEMPDLSIIKILGEDIVHVIGSELTNSNMHLEKAGELRDKLENECL